VTPRKEVTSGNSYSLGSIKTFHYQKCSVNIAMIELVDLPLHGRKLIGDFGEKQNELSEV